LRLNAWLFHILHIGIDIGVGGAAIDITYIRLLGGFVYWMAIMDWYSRYVLSWELSNSLDTHFCLTAVEQALACGRPQIFNRDQGSPFASSDFTGRRAAARGLPQSVPKPGGSGVQAIVI